MNFFEITCQQMPISEILFGLCDDQYGGKAYADTDIANKAEWVAIVKNDNQKIVIFTAIDKCVIKDNEEQSRGRCDAMLNTDDFLCFVELKNKAKRWEDGAIAQVESTIAFFIEYHDASVFKHKKAFICNKKHSHFHAIDNEFNLRFFRKYGFRIDIQAQIIII